jgi:hypothetical protein
MRSFLACCFTLTINAQCNRHFEDVFGVYADLRALLFKWSPWRPLVTLCSAFARLQSCGLILARPSPVPRLAKHRKTCKDVSQVPVVSSDQVAIQP